MPTAVLLDEGRIESIFISNEDSIVTFADTASPLPVAPVVFAYDSSGRLVSDVPPTYNVTLRATVLQVLYPGRHANKTMIVNGVNVSLTSDVVVLRNVTRFPVVLDTVQITRNGTGFGLLVEFVGSGSSGYTILWGSAVSGKGVARLYPADVNITVSYCDPEGTLSGLGGVWVVYPELQICNATSFNVYVQGMILQNMTGSTTVTVVGWKFEYEHRNELRCLYTNALQRWTLSSEGDAATYVSSCIALCPVPPAAVPHPSRRSDAVQPQRLHRPDLAATIPGWAVAREVLVGHALEQRDRDGRCGTCGWRAAGEVGSQKLRQERQHAVRPHRSSNRGQAWHEPTKASTTSRDSSTCTLLRGASQRLNETFDTRFRGSTCGPVPGEASLSGVTVVNPDPGDYSILLSSEGLSEAAVLLNIRNRDTVIDHRMALTGPKPLSFIGVTVDTSTRGLLPVQPQVSLFAHLGGGVFSDIIDRNISDMQVIATVSPRSGRAPSEQERGVGLRSCITLYGNCELFLQGTAKYSTLRFEGISGEEYVVTIRMMNDTLKVNNVSFIVSVPTCPFYTDVPIKAELQFPLNTSLVSPVLGVSIKAWKLEPPPSMLVQGDQMPNGTDGYACRFRGMTFPARFDDPLFRDVHGP